MSHGRFARGATYVHQSDGWLAKGANATQATNSAQSDDTNTRLAGGWRERATAWSDPADGLGLWLRGWRHQQPQASCRRIGAVGQSPQSPPILVNPSALTNLRRLSVAFLSVGTAQSRRPDTAPPIPVGFPSWGSAPGTFTRSPHSPSMVDLPLFLSGHGETRSAQRHLRRLVLTWCSPNPSRASPMPSWKAIPA
ncbi:hypothetical protein BO71DRAFT_435561 [Aspergillus ellipticus CBS 707.79]|uniref:Uncharacterized protein n=1 Tax=Aspergillus ellipticus CBS 707.79 TaxID=1448320 RepID=A0A319D249_9EURO|nr:hypothetical protein BO71DRAFT_435561 [Aspergillus ellipticus CBS 707.79]